MNTVGKSSRKRKAPGTALEAATFNNTYNKVLREFYKTSNSTTIERTNNINE
jgi:hypothetical protein